MDAQAYIDEMRAKQRRNLIIGVVVVVILAIIIVPGFFKEEGYNEADLAAALDAVPELALTDSEKALADTILEPDTFRSKLTYDLTGSTTFTMEEVKEIIEPVLPEDAAINEIGVQGAVVYIDYRTGDLRIVLEYVDADRSGTVDQIRKAVSHLEDQPEPLVPVSLDLFQISWDVRTENAKLLAVENFS